MIVTRVNVCAVYGTFHPQDRVCWRRTYWHAVPCAQSLKLSKHRTATLVQDSTHDVSACEVTLNYVIRANNHDGVEFDEQLFTSLGFEKVEE